MSDSIIKKGKHMSKINLNIVLVEPQIPQNTGNIARTCAATNSNLHIIKPIGFEIDDKKLKRAGLDYWHMLNIKYYENLTDFFEQNHGNFFYFSTKAKKVYSALNYPPNSFLVFGREDAGLPELLLLKNQHSCVRIPMISESRSLNLSNAVAIATYEILRQHNFSGFRCTGNLTSFNWR